MYERVRRIQLEAYRQRKGALIDVVRQHADDKDGHQPEQRLPFRNNRTGANASHRTHDEHEFGREDQHWGDRMDIA